MVYLIMYTTGIGVMAAMVRRGPQPGGDEAAAVESGRPNRPFESAARAAPHS
jgi:hypothetical protein